MSTSWTYSTVSKQPIEFQRQKLPYMYYSRLLIIVGGLNKLDPTGDYKKQMINGVTL
jgi:hypothetical protein